jgi:hypothetical protein
MLGGYIRPRPLQSYPLVYIDYGWAAALNLPYDRYSNQTAMEAIGAYCATSVDNRVNEFLFSAGDQIAIPRCLQTALALYLTDASCRSQSAVPAYLLATGHTKAAIKAQAIYPLGQGNAIANNITRITPTDFDESVRSTQFHFRILRYGYGYGFRGVTIYIATVALLLHVLVALIHIGVVMTKGMSSSSWGSVGEMIVLAVNSQPTEKLQKTCAEVDETATWGFIVKVREPRKIISELFLLEMRQSR